MTADGPAHGPARVVDSRDHGAYRQVTLAAAAVADAFRPGMFLAVSVPVGLARRPFWIHRVRPTGGFGASVELLVERRGPGSAWLADLEPGAEVVVTGPLGRPFALPKEPVACLLVGEGVSAAVVLPLLERLTQRGCPVSLLLGGCDARHVVTSLEARRRARSITVVTDDGSMGAGGAVADVVDATVAASGADVVYAAGPTATLHAVAAAAERHGAWSQTALEQPLACGTGLCHGCVVPLVGEDGISRMVRPCVEGPVFRGDRVRWEDLLAIEEPAR